MKFRLTTKIASNKVFILKIEKQYEQKWYSTPSPQKLVLLPLGRFLEGDWLAPQNSIKILENLFGGSSTCWECCVLSQIQLLS